jgi:hypothetical protein
MVVALLAACASWAAAVSIEAFQKATPEAFSGSWLLNETASTNPGGPAANAPRQGDGRSGGGDRGGGGSATAADKAVSGLTGGKTVPQVDTQFSPEEQARTLADLKIMQAVPQKLTIQASAKGFNLTYEGGGSSTAVTFKHTTDGKKTKVFEKLKIEGKVRWSNGVFKRELSTPDALTVNEEYALSADGKQLIVVLVAKSGMWRIPEAANPPIKRVYDRVQ